MAGTGHIVLLVCVGLCVIQSASALKCYHCLIGSRCNDEFDASGVSTVTCTGSCLKVKTGDTVVRSCSIVSLGNKCDSVSEDGLEVSSCSCTSDLCNSASAVKVSMVTGVMAVFAAVIKSLY